MDNNTQWEDVLGNTGVTAQEIIDSAEAEGKHLAEYLLAFCQNVATPDNGYGDYTLDDMEDLASDIERDAEA